MISPTGKPLVLAPTRANVGIEFAYRRRLDRLIEEMNHSVLFWIGARYKANEPEIAKLASDGYDAIAAPEPGIEPVGFPWAASFFASDASPARDLIDALRELRN